MPVLQHAVDDVPVVHALHAFRARSRCPARPPPVPSRSAVRAPRSPGPAPGCASLNTASTWSAKLGRGAFGYTSSVSWTRSARRRPPSPLGQPVARKERHHHRLFAQQDAAYARVLALQAPEADVDAALLQRLQLFHRRHFMQRHLDLRVALAVAAHDLGQLPYSVEATKPTDNLRSSLPTRWVIVFRSRTWSSSGLAWPGRTARPRSAVAGAIPFRSAPPRALPQLLDLPAQRRLGNVQALGGAREILFFRYRDEVAQMPQFHFHTFQVLKRIPNRCWTRAS